MAAISKASIEHEHKLQRTGWIACDPLAVAVAIRPELIEEVEVCCLPHACACTCTCAVALDKVSVCWPLRARVTSMVHSESFCDAWRVVVSIVLD